MRKTLLSTLATALMIAGAGTALAEESFPTQPITLVVGYTPGGGTDTLARTVSEKAGELFGQRVIIDNRPGGNGIIGINAVAEAQPDGYTLLLGNIGPISVVPSLYDTLPYDPAEALEPVTLIAEAPLAVLVNAQTPAHTLEEFVAYVSEQPGSLTYSTAGAGTSNHIAAELLNLRAGTAMRHIPYGGASQAMTALLSGEVDMYMAPLPTALPHIEAGNIRALAITSGERLASLPDVPTTAEAGYGDIVVTTWYGLLAPTGTPPEVVTKIQETYAAAASSEEIADWLMQTAGAVPVGSTSEEYGEFLRVEREKWAEVIEAAGITLE